MLCYFAKLPKLGPRTQNPLYGNTFCTMSVGSTKSLILYVHEYALSVGIQSNTQKRTQLCVKIICKTVLYWVTIMVAISTVMPEYKTSILNN